MYPVSVLMALFNMVLLVELVLCRVMVVKWPKFTALSFPTNQSILSSLFKIMHYDIWGPTHVPSLSGYLYYVSFIDDYSHYTWIYFIKHRFVIPIVYQTFLLLWFILSSRLMSNSSILAVREYIHPPLCGSFQLIQTRLPCRTSRSMSMWKRKL